MSLKIKGHAYKILRCKEVSNGLKWLMCIESYSIIFKTKGKNVPYEFAKTRIEGEIPANYLCLKVGPLYAKIATPSIIMHSNT